MCQDESEMEPRQAKMSQERPRSGQDDGVGRQDGARWGQNGVEWRKNKARASGPEKSLTNKVSAKNLIRPEHGHKDRCGRIYFRALREC